MLLGLLVAPGMPWQRQALWRDLADSRHPGRALRGGYDSAWWSCSGSAATCAGGPTLLVIVAAWIILILTHTRTALVAMVAGILVAGLSLIVAKARVRKLFAAAGVIAAIAVMTLSSVITAWLARGQGIAAVDRSHRPDQGLGCPLAFPRDRFQEIFGFGLSNDSFNGLPIDSNWLASYQDQGLFGVAICAMMLLFLLVPLTSSPAACSVRSHCFW